VTRETDSGRVGSGNLDGSGSLFSLESHEDRYA
jgi:hypothetical protein